MLGDEHGMSAHRRLLPVVGWIRRGESRADEVLAMAADRRHPLLGDVSPIGLGKVEAASEPRLPEPGKRNVVVPHRRVCCNAGAMCPVVAQYIKIGGTSQ